MAPTDRVRMQGHTVSRRIRDMLRWASTSSGVPVLIAQGAYRGSNAATASGSTHDREAVDLRVGHLTTGQRVKLVRALKDAGFAAWYRPTLPGVWGPHIHALPIGGDLSTSARNQVRAFDAGRDGLTGNRIDRTYRPIPRVKWNPDKGKPVSR